MQELSGHQVHACLLAGAIRNSLGAEIKFSSLAEIRLKFPNGLQDLPPHDGIIGAITDDTQMTLFTAEGLIRAVIRGSTKGICHPPSVVHHALLRWLETQGETTKIEIDRANGLIADKRLHRRRAPGMTCIAALRAARCFGDIAVNDSKGCGTIMRVAPIAFIVETGQVRELAKETSVLTHGHKTGQLAAAAWAELLAHVARGSDVEETAERLRGEYSLIDGGEETALAIRKALDAPRDGVAETVETLGGGWVAEEALSIALYSALATDNFEDGLRCAVTHSGDSDSTGAIAGNLLGLLYPQHVHSHRWAQQIECADLIARLSLDLANAPGWESREIDEQWDDYPGW